jgi:glycosyltransferase involved in cell wall biosynthesis
VTHSLAVIILTLNEQKHIERCIRSLMGIAQHIIVVDSFSTDDTVKISLSLGAKVVQRQWKNYADQFQWAIENCADDVDWLMRMDADEYLEPDLASEILEKLPSLPVHVDGIYLKRKVLFMGQWIRYGGFYPHTLLRIWRNGQGHIEQRWMDEHLVLPSASKAIVLNGHLVDDNQKGITFWISKHNRYASREMADILIRKYFPSQGDYALREMYADPQARRKRFLKNNLYLKLPIGLRAILYFFYRYFIQFGFLDGSKGFIWHFFQGLWYRLLVDVKVLEVETQAKSDPQKVKAILKDDYGIVL